MPLTKETLQDSGTTSCSRAQLLREKTMHLERELNCANFRNDLLTHVGTASENLVRNKKLVQYLKIIAANTNTNNGFLLQISLNSDDKSTFKAFFSANFANQGQCKGDILLISHEFTRTGAPVVIADAAKELRRQGYFVVVASPKDGAMRQELLNEGITVIVDDELSDGIWDSNKQSKNGTWAMDNLICNFDLVVLCTAVLHNIASRYNNTDIPIMWWLHEGNETLSALANIMPKELGKNVKVYCGGHYVQNMLSVYGLDYPSEMFNYGIKDRAVDELKQPDAVTTDKRKVVFAVVGALCRRKGQDVFINAVKKLPYQYLVKSEFLIVGGPYEKVTAALVNDFCRFWPNAKLLTEISHDELFELYKKIDCIVAPSRDDPLPVVLAEAMMFSKICICSDSVGTSFYLEDGKNGFVFESENSDELSQKLMLLIDHFDELEPVRKSSRQIYESVFTNDIFSTSLLKIVEQNITK